MSGLIGVMGGTFDPVHNGHLRTAVEFRDRFRLDRLYLVPCRVPPHRTEPSASPAQRAQMLRLAIDGVDRLVVDEREIRRDGPSFTVDTLRSFRAQVGERESVCLLLGSDAFNQLHTWREWQQVLSLAHVVVVDRPGNNDLPNPVIADELARRRADSVRGIEDSPSGCIRREQFTFLDISASKIRALRAAGRTLKYLTPESVINYIEQTDLYRDRQNG